MKTITRVILSCCFLALIAVPARPQGSPVTEEVEVCGLKNVSLKKVKQIIRTQPGKPFSAEQANQDFDRLMGTKAFDGERSKVVFVDGERGGKIVRFELEEIHKK